MAAEGEATTVEVEVAAVRMVVVGVALAAVVVVLTKQFLNKKAHPDVAGGLFVFREGSFQIPFCRLASPPPSLARFPGTTLLLGRC